MQLKDKFLKWYNNFPYDGVELTEETYKYIKVDEEYNIKKKELWILEALKNKVINKKGLLLNLSTIYIHYHFFNLEEDPKNKDTERKMLFWKLKNKVSFLKEEEVIFNYYKLDEKKYVLFTLDKELLEGLGFNLPINKEFIINPSIIGVYNYYVNLIKKNKIKEKNVILVNTGETITDLLFIKDGKLQFMRSFELGITDYLKKIDEYSENILDGLNYMLSETYIPQDIEELLNSGKLEKFDKIKGVNQNWMKKIDESIKYHIPKKEDRKKYTILFSGYENYFNNLDYILGHYLNLPVKKIEKSLKIIPYISIIGNMINLHEKK